MLVGAQFKAGAARFVLRVHQPPLSELGFTVFGGEVDMLFAAFVLHAQFILRGRSQDIPGTVIAGNDVRVF